MDEDAQLLQAIALSMRQESKNEEEEKKEVVEKQDSEKEEKNDTQEPLEKSVLDEFTDNVFPGKWKMTDVWHTVGCGETATVHLQIFLLAKLVTLLKISNFTHIRIVHPYHVVFSPLSMLLERTLPLYLYMNSCLSVFISNMCILLVLN